MGGYYGADCSGVELSSAGVTVTCSVSAEDGVYWYFTLESGRLPLVCGGEDCSVCKMEQNCTGGVPRRAYLVLRVDKHWCTGFDWSVVGTHEYSLVVERLCVEAFDEVRGGMMRAAVRLSRCNGLACEGDGEWLQWMAKYDAPMCEYVEQEQAVMCSRWVRVECYRGVFPFGGGHWFTGITDSIGDKRGAEGDWMRCNNSRCSA